MTKQQQHAIHEACKALQASQRAMLGDQHGAWCGTAHMEKAIAAYEAVMGSPLMSRLYGAPPARFVSLVSTPYYLTALDAEGHVWQYIEVIGARPAQWVPMSDVRANG